MTSGKTAGKRPKWGSWSTGGGQGGGGCEFRSCSRLALINPRGQGPGRTGGHLRVGFSLKIMGMIKPQASSPTFSLSKRELFYNCTRMRVIFTCQASIRYQTQRTKINLKEQRRLVEGARCFPACQSVKATLCAGRCSHHVTFKSNPGLKDEIIRSLWKTKQGSFLGQHQTDILTFYFILGYSPISNAVTVSGREQRDSATYIHSPLNAQRPFHPVCHTTLSRVACAI